MLGLLALASVGCLERQTDEPASSTEDLPGEPRAQPPQIEDEVLAAPAPDGRIEVSPVAVDFGAVTPGASEQRWVAIDNGGEGVLTVREIDIVGDQADAFSLIAGIPQMVRIVRGYEPLRVQVGFRPQSAGRVRAWLRIRSDDPVRPDVRVELVGDGAGRCLRATPAQLHFPELAPGEAADAEVTLTSCGRSPTHVRAVGFAAGTSYAYAFQGDRGGQRLEPGEALTVSVRYQPSLPGVDAGRLEIKTDGVPEGLLYVDLIGQARAEDRPIAPPRCLAEAEGVDGDWEVVDDGDGLRRGPMTDLELRATGSQTDSPQPLGYAWRVVDGPRDSLTEIEPDPSAGQVRARLDLLGDYVFEVRVFDAAGQEDVCRISVEAATSDDIYVESVWDTPLDPVVGDEGPQAGANVDVHVQRPGGDGWFCDPDDASPANPDPDWGVQGRSDDDPSVLDDRDGWGPEVFRLAHALQGHEQGAAYAIAMHYADDAGYGASVVTTRVFVLGQRRPALELTRRMQPGELWEVGEVRWPAAQVAPVDRLGMPADTRGCAAY